MRYDDDPTSRRHDDPAYEPRRFSNDAARETGRADEDEVVRERHAPALALIAEHLELADKLRADGNHEDADALAEIAREMAEELAAGLSELQLHRLCREPEPPPPIVLGPPVDDHLPQVPVVLFQSPWLRSSGSSGMTLAPVHADRAPFGPSEPTVARREFAPSLSTRIGMSTRAHAHVHSTLLPPPPRQTSAVPPGAHFSRRYPPASAPSGAPYRPPTRQT